MFVFCQLWVVFSQYFSEQFFFLALPSFYSSWSLNVRCFVIIPLVPETMFIFFSLLPLSFRLGNFYCSIFQFTDSFLCPFILLLSSSIELFQLLHFFSSKNFIWFFFISSISLPRFFIFLFFASIFVIAYGSLFIIAALKYLSNNSNISITSMLVSIDCLSSFSLRSFWFLV